MTEIAQDEFLGDSTGNRRFWVISVQKTVDLNQLRTERDRIWAAAVTLYLSGESWWLSQGEEQTAEALREDYQVTDPWLDAIIDYINHPETEEPVTTEAILNGVLRIETARQEQSHKVRVANILSNLVRLIKQLGRLFRSVVIVLCTTVDYLTSPLLRTTCVEILYNTDREHNHSWKKNK